MHSTWNRIPARPTTPYLDAPADLVDTYKAMFAAPGGDHGRAYLTAYFTLARLLKGRETAWWLFDAHVIRYVRQTGFDMLQIIPRSESLDWRESRL